MRRVKVSSWEELDTLPEGEWVEVVGGLDIEVVDKTTRRRAKRLVIPLKPEVARSLRPGHGEVLEARMRGRNLELTRRRARSKASARG